MDAEEKRKKKLDLFKKKLIGWNKKGEQEKNIFKKFYHFIMEENIANVF